LDNRWMITMLACLWALCGCAGQQIWHSQPSAADLVTPDFEASLKPVGPQGGNFFDAFQFTLINRSARPLVIDWTRSRFVHNNRLRGTLAFTGLTAQNVQTPPPETVAAGQRTAKTLWPLTLLGWVPIRDRSLDPGASGFAPGVLPEGENGLLLVIGEGTSGKQHKLSVVLSPQPR